MNLVEKHDQKRYILCAVGSMIVKLVLHAALQLH